MRRIGLSFTIYALVLSGVAAAETPRAQEMEKTASAEIFWRSPASSDRGGSLFGALSDFSRRAEEYRMLRARGVMIRSLSFQYKNFSYERNFFHLYKGFRLYSLLDGRVDLGLYKHRVFGGMLSGPAGAYLPSSSNRIELNLRWNISER